MSEYQEAAGPGITQCRICPHDCRIPEGKKGICGARSNQAGRIIDDNYGVITSIALDPIEKKPLHRFCPGSMILSVGSYGCNFRCPFCQNHSISMVHEQKGYQRITPEELADHAEALRSRGNIGLAYTYNEPLIGFEFVRDCSKLIRERGMKNVAVTNGYINQAPLLELLPTLDAMNVDMKSFNPDFYRKIGGDLEVVKETIATAVHSGTCHVEVTTLVVPGENDSREEMKALASWLASLDPAIPLHISRFHPAYRMMDKPQTPKETILSLADLARDSLSFVYPGNI